VTCRSDYSLVEIRRERPRPIDVAPGIVQRSYVDREETEEKRVRNHLSESREALALTSIPLLALCATVQ
jgi:hypothetical protein